MEINPETAYKSNIDKQSILIIGAGPTGILSVRHLKDKSNIICIESKEDIGGMWHKDKYTEQNHPNLEKNAYFRDNGVLHSSLYENLISNLPKFSMMYKGFPVKEEYHEFMKSEEFYEYLQEYCKYHDIKRHVLFNTYVQSVRLSQNLTQKEREKVNFEINKRFLIEVSSAEDYNKDIKYFQADSVIVANGHFSKPNYPEIQNEDFFGGYKLHMHYLRENTFSQFTDKHLVIYGSNLSAQDVIAIVLKRNNHLQQPKKITVIGNPQMTIYLQKSKSYKVELEQGKLRFVGGQISRFDSKNSLILGSGEKIEDIDCVLYATGYQFSLPFLEKFSDIDNLLDFYNPFTRKNCFGPLYKKMFCIKEPHLIFLGCLQNTISNQLGFERQAIVASLFVTGQIDLPSKQEMQSEFEQEISSAKASNLDLRDFFKVSFFLGGMNEIQYFKSLAVLSKMEFDNEFNEYLINTILPALNYIITNGEYPTLKSMFFTNQFPQNYSPSLKFF